MKARAVKVLPGLASRFCPTKPPSLIAAKRFASSLATAPTRLATMTPTTSSDAPNGGLLPRTTTILPVQSSGIGKIVVKSDGASALEDWDMDWAKDSPDFQRLQKAASQLKTSDIPVAFPTETVYGLGADATRSPAVRGIFAAKRRPADNPLIVHIHSLQQLRSLLQPTSPESSSTDPIPAIYKPLIERFWPGPLTIILALPATSPFAPETTAGLTTFGARMPRNILALALLKLSNVPVAAPSANASTKPSPTTAEHVLEDMDGRIETIVDGGPCDVGVESTVVDGLCDPPLVLRPGGITIQQLRQCPGWENVGVGYKDAAEMGGSAPRAPGMKYRHYSPKASVVLYEAGRKQPTLEELAELVPAKGKLGVIRTRSWPPFTESGKQVQEKASLENAAVNGSAANGDRANNTLSNLLESVPATFTTTIQHFTSPDLSIYEVHIGTTDASIAKGIFSALRLLDGHHVDRMVVEGIDDSGNSELAAAIMNRVRKAADTKLKPEQGS